MREFVTVVILVISALFAEFALYDSSKDQVFESDSGIKTLDTKAKRNATVLELFTSQGCSSCPPADALLKKIQSQFGDEVIVLSFHVDYWNYIGWEDPFSKREYTERQSAYNLKFGYRSNYTPQLVINGQEHLVGSDAPKIYERIRKHKGRPHSTSVEITEVSHNGLEVSFDYNISDNIENYQLIQVLVIDERVTAVTRGENRARKLVNTNIVASMQTETLTASMGSGHIPKPPLLNDKDKVRLVLLLEDGDHNIVAAARSSVLN